jgi:arylsulfatase A
MDGVSVVPILKHPETKLERDTLYWHYPLEKPHFLGGRSAGAIRTGDWKLIEFFDTGEIELYNLADDIGEHHNLADERVDKKRELLRALHTWQRQVGATFPQGQPKGN